ncbi:RNAPII transcription regulator C-terminal-domain-containing protein [Coprinopsis sp. MPI-PUGE-AT-0042]|nr:RNAPII transcription regulator C-terminal-domain-containing protein [Coprinopsis sp. MPI-PUGE-AT-0042]
MEATERLVRTWMASQRDEDVIQISEEITLGKTSLLNVVKVSGEYLTSEENGVRSKGVELLSLVTARLHPVILNKATTRTLVNFYCDKLEDADTIIPALQGLLTLAGLPTFAGIETTATLEALLRHVRMKALTQSQRFMVYSILDSLIARQREVLKTLGLKFLDGYVSMVEGEKDPRNLLVVFAMDKVILIEFDISDRVQTFYDIIFCYFPISFRPPPNNPGGITADDLRASLRQCVSASPLFGPLAIPHFLENLVSGSRPAKRDTLETLAACLPIYGAITARNFGKKMWNSLKLEVFQPVDVATEQQALIALQVLITTIYGSDDASLVDQDMQGLAREACEECIQILREPEKSQAKPATKILCSFVTTTPFVSRYTLSQAVPHLTKLFINPDEAGSRQATLILLAEFIEAAQDSASHVGTDDPLLSPYKDEVLGVLTAALKVHNLRLPALAGLKGLVTTQNLLSDEEIGFVTHSTSEIIQDDPTRFDEISDGIIELLVSISNVSPAHVAEQTLPLLFSSLPDSAPARDAAEARGNCWKTLSTLQALCRTPVLFETLVVRLSTKLELMCSPSRHPDDVEPTAAYAHAILKTLANVLTVKVLKKDADVPKYIERLVARLFNLFIHTALESDDSRSLVATDRRLLDAASDVITLVVRSLPLQRQEIYLKSTFQALLTGNVAPISEGHFSIPSSPLRIFEPGAPSRIGNLVTLFAAASVPMYKDLDLGIPNLNEFLTNILFWAIKTADTDVQRTAATRLIAVIVNRKAEGVTEFLGSLETTLWPDEVVDASRTTESRLVCLSIWAYVAKALLVRNHALSLKFSNKLFEVFDDTNINWHAAKAIGTIAGHDDLFTKPNHAVLRPLYAQKYVNDILPKTIAGSEDASDSSRQLAYLVALSSLIKFTPRATYASQLPSLIPLLVRGLDLPDPEIRNNVIETFLAAVEGDTPEKSVISEHASTLINAMLKNCDVANMSSPKVRISALKFLGKLPSLVKSETLTRHKNEVVKELSKVLDDPKRSVRKEAVDARYVAASLLALTFSLFFSCRTHWFKYGG